jgi:hypothetical protein
MPRLFVHIGTPKTGSTAIQYFLARNFEALRDRGVNFIREGRKREAHNLVLQARRAGNIAAVMDKVVAEIESRPEATHVLTSEMYFGAGAAQDLADALPGALRRETRILVYLRRQDRFLEALYKQRVKTGRYHGDALDFARAKLGNGNYLRALAPYAEAFGPENILVRPFERQLFRDGNIVCDAADLFGVKGMKDLFVPGSVDNLTLSHEITQLLARLGRATDVNIKDIIRHLSQDPPDGAARSGDCFSLAERREIMAGFEATNQELRQLYRPDLPRLFTMSDLAPGAPDTTPDATERLHRMERAQDIVFTALEEMRAKIPA